MKIHCVKVVQQIWLLYVVTWPNIGSLTGKSKKEKKQETSWNFTLSSNNKQWSETRAYFKKKNQKNLDFCLIK